MSNTERAMLRLRVQAGIGALLALTIVADRHLSAGVVDSWLENVQLWGAGILAFDVIVRPVLKVIVPVEATFKFRHHRKKLPPDACDAE